MHPILFKIGPFYIYTFEIGPFSIYTYGFFIALAFLSGIFWASKEAARVGEEPEVIIDLSFWIIVAAIIGSRLLFVLLNLKDYLQAPVNILKIWEGGLVFHGGLIASILVGLYYLKRHHLSVGKYIDILAPALALGQGIGRIGCFMAGCCYGKETNLPWGVIFTHPNTLALADVHLHPTQIYSSLADLSLFLFLIWWRKRKSFEGEVFWIYLGIYAIIRFTIDFFRGDEIRSFFQVLSLTQVLSLVFFFSALYMLWVSKRKMIKKQ